MVYDFEGRKIAVLRTFNENHPIHEYISLLAG